MIVPIQNQENTNTDQTTAAAAAAAAGGEDDGDEDVLALRKKKKKKPAKTDATAGTGEGDLQVNNKSFSCQVDDCLSFFQERSNRRYSWR